MHCSGMECDARARSEAELLFPFILLTSCGLWRVASCCSDRKIRAIAMDFVWACRVSQTRLGYYSAERYSTGKRRHRDRPPGYNWSTVPSPLQIQDSFHVRTVVRPVELPVEKIALGFWAGVRFGIGRNEADRKEDKPWELSRGSWWA
jgi:hypothetical protein